MFSFNCCCNYYYCNYDNYYNYNREYQGSQAGQLWMLSDNSLRRQCQQRGLDADGTNAEMISLLAPLLRQKESGRYLMDTNASSRSSGDGNVGAISIGSADADDLPSNMHTMSERQLKSVAAGYGIQLKHTDTKIDIIEALERARFKDTAPMMLMDGGKKNKRGRAGSDETGKCMKRKKRKEDSCEDSDSDFEILE